MTRNRIITAENPCRRCGGSGMEYRGRGLCSTCYNSERDHGRLANWPRATRPLDDVIEECEVMRTSLIDASKRLGYSSPKSLERVLHRGGRGDLVARMKAA